MQVAIPIPKPEKYASADRYKIQFTFDGAHIPSFSRQKLALYLLSARWQAADAILVHPYAAHNLKGNSHYISFQEADRSGAAAALPASHCNAICRGPNGDALAEAAGERGA